MGFAIFNTLQLDSYSIWFMICESEEELFHSGLSEGPVFSQDIDMCCMQLKNVDSHTYMFIISFLYGTFSHYLVSFMPRDGCTNAKWLWITMCYDITAVPLLIPVFDLAIFLSNVYGYTFHGKNIPATPRLFRKHLLDRDITEDRV